ncbi:MAG: class I SAM-dependent methyltransferase [Trueperaceae bacterium]|nr:class I SAM-dependent methyltransferase [Trueperaceae bacterium]
MKQDSFWENPEVVERFVRREPDHRLVPLLATAPKNWKILDIGCAAGRNTVFLAEQGFDVFALDASKAMVEKTRERLSVFMSYEEARQRVIQGQMQNLSMFEDKVFELVVALGVYQDAESFEIWQQAVTESARVLKRGGLCLVAQFAPDHQPHGKQARAVEGEPHVFVGASRDDERRLTLLDASEMDKEFARVGLFPKTATEQVQRTTEKGFRSTVNGLYQKS